MNISSFFLQLSLLNEENSQRYLYNVEDLSLSPSSRDRRPQGVHKCSDSPRGG